MIFLKRYLEVLLCLCFFLSCSSVFSSENCEQTFSLFDEHGRPNEKYMETVGYIRFVNEYFNGNMQAANKELSKSTDFRVIVRRLIWERIVPIDTPLVDFKEWQRRVQAAGIKTAKEYGHYQELHDDMPAFPIHSYREQWSGWVSALGIESPWVVDFKEWQRRVQAAGIKSKKAYMEYQKLYNDMPKLPDAVYREQWPGWMPALGVEPPRFADFKEWQRRVQAAGIKTVEEYDRYQELHDDMPRRPWMAYEKQVLNGRQAQVWLQSIVSVTDENQPNNASFVDFKEWQRRVQAAGIKSKKVYMEYQKLYNDMPKLPDAVYGEQWINWTAAFTEEKPKNIIVRIWGYLFKK